MALNLGDWMELSGVGQGVGIPTTIESILSPPRRRLTPGQEQAWQTERRKLKGGQRPPPLCASDRKAVQQAKAALKDNSAYQALQQAKAAYRACKRGERERGRLPRSSRPRGKRGRQEHFLESLKQKQKQNGGTPPTPKQEAQAAAASGLGLSDWMELSGLGQGRHTGFAFGPQPWVGGHIEQRGLTRGLPQQGMAEGLRYAFPDTASAFIDREAKVKGGHGGVYAGGLSKKTGLPDLLAKMLPGFYRKPQIAHQPWTPAWGGFQQQWTGQPFGAPIWTGSGYGSYGVLPVGPMRTAGHPGGFQPPSWGAGGFPQAGTAAERF